MNKCIVAQCFLTHDYCATRTLRGGYETGPFLKVCSSCIFNINKMLSYHRETALQGAL